MNPHELFVRILHELYAEPEAREIVTPAEMTGGAYADLAYQVDAVRRGVEIIERHGGVIVADVVGLGKSVIAAAIARNLMMERTVVITPPHLKRQWLDYVEEMGLRSTVVVSGGNLEKLYREGVNRRKPTLYIIDEAHRYRNEGTASYVMLHRLMRTRAENRVMLLSATPYNNRPQDVYAMLKLFQVPGRATVAGVGSLAVRFQKLGARYNKLAKAGEREGLREIAAELRELLEPVMIRRSRIDLVEIERYAEDLRRQGIEFPKVRDPEVVSYELGEYEKVYIETLKKIGGKKWTGAKYKPLSYLKDPEGFAERTGVEFNLTQQLNLAKLARRLLVLRFESSVEAFRVTLAKMIEAYREAIRRWEEEGGVLVSRRVVDEESEGAELLMEQETEGLVVRREEFDGKLIEEMRADLAVLMEISREWSEIGARDPKLVRVEEMVRRLLGENPRRKVVIFSSFAETAKYVGRELARAGVRTLVYTGSSKRSLKRTIGENFDASYGEQKDEYDVVVATDALAEGANLHRAGVIINYDIPYNPTRVVQRLGRINRVNRKMFDELLIYNFFPTVLGEEIVKVRGIAKLKMLLINSVVGSDTKTLTADESLESYFAERYREAEASAEERSHDNEYRNRYAEYMEYGEVEKVLGREWPEQFVLAGGAGGTAGDGAAGEGASGGDMVDGRASGGGVDERVSYVFVERGGVKRLMKTDGTRGGLVRVSLAEGLAGFARGETAAEAEAVAGDGAVGDEEARERAKLRLELVREELTRPYELLKMTGCRGEAIEVIGKLEEVYAEDAGVSAYLEEVETLVREYDDVAEWSLKRIGRSGRKRYNSEVMLATMNEELPGWFVRNVGKKARETEVEEGLKIWMENG